MKYLMIFMMMVATNAFASEWCDGWRSGFKDAYKSETGRMRSVPSCPAMPARKAHEEKDKYKRAYHLGYKAGIEAANK